jgi:hypothetical protein
MSILTNGIHVHIAMCRCAQKNVQTICPSELIQPFNKPTASTLTSMIIALQNNFASAIKHSGMDFGY